MGIQSNALTDCIPDVAPIYLSRRTSARLVQAQPPALSSYSIRQRPRPGQVTSQPRTHQDKFLQRSCPDGGGQGKDALFVLFEEAIGSRLSGYELWDGVEVSVVVWLETVVECEWSPRISVPRV